MGKIRLIVAIEDDIYLDRICDYLETGHGRFITERFSDRQALANALRKKDRYDVILYEAQMLDKQQEKEIHKIRILLGKKDQLELTEGYYTIQEYQRIDDIANNILKICAADSRFMGIDVHTQGKAKIYAFTSPVGGAGVTTISLASALHVAKRNRKCLYINLEQSQSISSLLPTENITMTQVMRMAIENSPKLLTAIEGGQNTEPLSGLHYLGGFGDPTDFDSLKPEHMRNLATQLSSLNLYDVIIADIAWNPIQTGPFLEKAEKIFLISRNTDLSIEKTKQFIQYAEERELSYRNRLQIILNASNGQPNRRLHKSPDAEIPQNSLIIDTANFPAMVFNQGAFSETLAKLAQQF